MGFHRQRVKIEILNCWTFLKYIFHISGGRILRFRNSRQWNPYPNLSKQTAKTLSTLLLFEFSIRAWINTSWLICKKMSIRERCSLWFHLRCGQIFVAVTLDKIIFSQNEISKYYYQQQHFYRTSRSYMRRRWQIEMHLRIVRDFFLFFFTYQVKCWGKLDSIIRNNIIRWDEYVTIPVNRNLSNCEVARKKKSFSGSQRGLCVRAAAFYQLSYEDPYTEGRPIYWVHQPVKGMKHRMKLCELREYKCNEYMYHRDSLRWSRIHFICIPAVHIISFRI